MRRSKIGSRVKACLSAMIAVLLAFPFRMQAQQAAPAATPEATQMAPLPTVRNLKVVALAGNGEVNDLDRKVMAPLVVEVLDLQDRPMEGAEVVFRFPLKGPSATFADQKTSKTVRTNSQGEAAATGWAANNEVGTFQVHVTATYGNQLGETTISMSNAEHVAAADLNRVAKHKSLWSSKWFKIALIAGGAGVAAGIVLATRGGGGTPNAPTISVTAGAPQVGAP